MRTTILTACLALGLALGRAVPARGQADASPAYDVVIRGGRVLDRAGNAPQSTAALATNAATNTVAMATMSASCSAPNIRGASMDAKMKISDVAQNSSCRQVISNVSQVPGDNRVRTADANTIAAVTTAIMPDTWK